MAGRFLLRRLFSRLSSVPTSLLGPRASPSSTPAATRRTAEGEARTLLGDLAHGRRAPAHPPRCREIHGSVSISSTQLLLKNSQSLSAARPYQQHFSINWHAGVCGFCHHQRTERSNLFHPVRARFLGELERRRLARLKEHLQINLNWKLNWQLGKLNGQLKVQLGKLHGQQKSRPWMLVGKLRSLKRP
ncbi:hypothetical protein SEVIR_8G189800v4 [Setaria viridis]|uniref:Uncharacterized protein n=1 Tax=Setaria viridis TaxID=4556 RepID=A0A4V6D373_SETVI|nr:hypothetical protein SEVIR_8G189800v2 [Setaria viridis]